jgi:hypothetical protein
MAQALPFLYQNQTAPSRVIKIVRMEEYIIAV